MCLKHERKVLKLYCQISTISPSKAERFDQQSSADSSLGNFIDFENIRNLGPNAILELSSSYFDGMSITESNPKEENCDGDDELTDAETGF